ncbi:DUF1186 domain-containing protein [Paracoccus sp. (in: a-proteobacteria)]|uniref:DUF1186 domain-containing protein n=1 Tax=Paracoccus sp. TaxID=267 RepID=UPI00321F687D
MTPTAIMAAFEAQGPLPREALRAAGQSREAMVPVFLDYIARLQSARNADLERMDAFFFIAFLLAEWRETRAYRPLARLLRRDPEFLDALMGDSITESSARVMAGVFDGDLQPLFDIILDEAADSFLRGEMFDTLAIITLSDQTLRPQVTAFLADFRDCAGSGASEEIWWPWAECIAALGLSELEPQVRTVFDSKLISPDHSRFEDFAQRLQTTMETGRADWFTGHASNRLVTDTIAELGSWYCFSEEYLTRKAQLGLKVLSTPPREDRDPVSTATTGHVGRNDPCPCGSGKKFKKCCLQ